MRDIKQIGFDEDEMGVRKSQQREAQDIRQAQVAKAGDKGKGREVPDGWMQEVWKAEKAFFKGIMRGGRIWPPCRVASTFCMKSRHQT